jgi:hypothetical protein
MLWYPRRAPRCFRDQSNIATCPLVEPHHRFKIVKYKYHQSCAEKRYWPHLRVHRLSRGGPVAVDTLQTGYPHAQDLSPAPWCQTPHLAGEGSGAAACPGGSRPTPGVGELWHRHVPHGTGHAIHQERAPMTPHVPRLQTRLPVPRALASPHAPWHRARYPAGEGSGVTTCLVAPDSSPAWEGSGIAMCPRHQDHRPAGLRYCHISCGSRPTSRCVRALELPHVQWPSSSEACPCIPKVPDIRLIMATPGTRSRKRIKCVQDKPYAAYG